jgi:hypothetical protein
LKPFFIIKEGLFIYRLSLEYFIVLPIYTYIGCMNTSIVQAIKMKQRMKFIYNGKMRYVEPQCYGIGTKDTELLRVHQLAGGSEREPLFTVSKIENLKFLDEFFTKPGPNYKKGDSAMKVIYCEL